MTICTCGMLRTHGWCKLHDSDNPAPEPVNHLAEIKTHLAEQGYLGLTDSDYLIARAELAEKLAEKYEAALKWIDNNAHPHDKIRIVIHEVLKADK